MVLTVRQGVRRLGCFVVDGMSRRLSISTSSLPSSFPPAEPLSLGPGFLLCEVILSPHFEHPPRCVYSNTPLLPHVPTSPCSARINHSVNHINRWCMNWVARLPHKDISLSLSLISCKLVGCHDTAPKREALFHT